MSRSAYPFQDYTDYWGDYCKLILMAVVYTVIALCLYKKRPTEVAGNTMAFPVTEPVVKTMIAFPVSIFSGYLFQNITASDNEFAWYVFGCVFGFMLCCPVMEVIFRKDVKAVFKHPLQWVFNGACVIVCIVIFRFDVFGYDTYIPKEDKVASYAVYFSEVPNVNSMYGSTRDVVFDNMAITDNASTRKLLEHGAEITRDVRTEEAVYSENNEARYGYSSITVKYNMKNGEAIYRSYVIDMDDAAVLGWMKDTVDCAEYKQGAYPVLHEGAGANYVGLLLRYAYASENIALTPEQMQRFVAAYQKDLSKLTLEEILHEVTVAHLSFAAVREENQVLYAMNVNSYGPEIVTVEGYYDTTRYGEGELKYDFEESGYWIYPSFTETLKVLEELGIHPVSELTPEDVVTISVNDYSKEWEDTKGIYHGEILLEYTVAGDGEEKIRQLLDSITSNRMSSSFYSRIHVEQNIDVEIKHHYDGGGYISARFKKDCIPAFVLEDMEKTMQ